MSLMGDRRSEEINKIWDSIRAIESQLQHLELTDFSLHTDTVETSGGGSGGGASGTSEFTDSEFTLLDDGDDTKKLQYQLSGITTATTRTHTIPDRDLDLGNPVFDTAQINGALTGGGAGHDQFSDFVTNEHIDWTGDAGANNIHDNNIVSASITQHEGDIDHDALTNFVAAEHLDWSQDQGATNIHVNNITATAVTQHEASLTITESQISDLSHTVDTNLTTEEVQDIAGPLIATGGTKTGITITYQDVTNDMDFVVDHDAASNFVAAEHYDWTNDQGANNIHQNNITEASVTQHETAINHDNLSGFVANEHVALPAATSAVLNDLLDEDTMTSNSATKPASQQSIKAYVDNFNFWDDAPSGTQFTFSQNLSVWFGSNVDAVGALPQLQSPQFVLTYASATDGRYFYAPAWIWIPEGWKVTITGYHANTNIGTNFYFQEGVLYAIRWNESTETRTVTTLDTVSNPWGTSAGLQTFHSDSLDTACPDLGTYHDDSTSFFSGITYRVRVKKNGGGSGSLSLYGLAVRLLYEKL